MEDPTKNQSNESETETVTCSEALCTWQVGREGEVGPDDPLKKLTYLTNAVRVLYILDRSFNKVSTQLPDGSAVCTSSWKKVTSVPSCMMMAFSMRRFDGTASEEASPEER